MRTFPAGLSALLASGATTLALCFRVERRDGAVYGFTEHDRRLTFGSVEFEPETGLKPSETAASLGLAVDTMEVAGALSSDTINEDDIAAKLWDDAGVEVWLVDWSEVANRALMFSGSFGEIERGPLAFRTELRTLAHRLNQATGRIFGSTCDADLGDAHCGVDMESVSFSATATVSTVISRSAFRTAGLAGFASGWCKAGKLVWTSGANDGAAIEVKRHIVSGTSRQIELAEEMAFDIEAGDGFSITAGCDKTVETCHAKFDNVPNFRGFPGMPGNDWISSYPNREDGNDGGSLTD